jgi:Fe-S-cluster-containing hydrogenase component 2
MIPMSLAAIDYKKCQPNNCDGGKCIAVDVCPIHALEQEASFEAPFVIGGCYACNKCVETCPLHAIILV